MPQLSPRVELPYLMPSQAQKHVTHNEALTRLDALTQLSLQGFADEDPPALPTAGDMHGLGVAPTGVWAGQAGDLAYWDGTTWLFLTPQEGWRAWGVAEQELRIWRGGAWQQAVSGLENLSGLGVGATSDATNRVSVAADAVLLSHAGAGHQLKINKAGVGDTASLLFQSNWAGRAEMGLAGEDAFALKISADGSTWQTALRADPAVGQVSMMPATASDTVSFADHGDMSGFVRNGATVPVDGPQGIGRHWGLSLGDATHGAQMLIHDSARAYLRTRSGAGFGDWAELLRREDMLGQVAEAGGMPTGAMMESGTNANGSYTRFADGMQICFGTVLLSYTSNSFLNGTWTYPASFAGDPQVAGIGSHADANGTNTTPSAAEIGSLRYSALFAGSVNFVLARNSGATNFAAADTFTVQATAIGRWF